MLARHAHGEVLSGTGDAAGHRCYQGWFSRGYVVERGVPVPVATGIFDGCVSGS